MKAELRKRVRDLYSFCLLHSSFCLCATVRYLGFTSLLIALWTAAGGCADTSKQPTTQPLTAAQRNQKILDDPMGYGPSSDPNFVGQHGLGPSEKPSLKKDIDDFLNP